MMKSLFLTSLDTWLVWERERSVNKRRLPFCLFQAGLGYPVERGFFLVFLVSGLLRALPQMLCTVPGAAAQTQYLPHCRSSVNVGLKSSAPERKGYKLFYPEIQISGTCGCRRGRNQGPQTGVRNIKRMTTRCYVPPDGRT